MLLKEYRICMPMTVAEYRIGQLYMIAKHSHEQSEKGEGVEVIKNEKCEHSVHGEGQFTEKRVHLSSRLPTWIQKLIPKIFYITEKAWNYYPFTITEYTCSFMPKFTIYIETKYADDNGCSKNLCNLSEADLKERIVEELDIAYDEVQEKHYKEAEDPTKFVSKKTGRGPLQRDWKDFADPIMCSYKAVKVKFEVWGLQTKVEEFTHRHSLEECTDQEQIKDLLMTPEIKINCIKEILLLGHRQAFTWIDEWFDMTIEDIRKYEQRMHAETNEKVLR